MPLKTDDLKTVDSYKKALKVDGAKLTPGGKIKFWVYKDVELPTAGGQKQKLPALIVFVDDNAAKTILKKTAICRGVCGLQDGKIAFEPAQGDVPYAHLKTYLPQVLGKAMLMADADAQTAAAKPPQKEEKGQAGAPYPGIVKYRQALLQFAQAKTEVKSQIGALKNAILKAGPNEATFANALSRELEKLNDELAGAVDEAMKASENQASPATDAVKLKIRKYLTELASNPVIKKVEANPLGVKVTIGKTLGGALTRIKEAMPV